MAPLILSFLPFRNRDERCRSRRTGARVDIARTLLALAAVLFAAAPVLAQLQLPGAVRGPSQTGPAAGTGSKPSGSGARRSSGGDTPADPRPTPVKAPSERSLAGKVLQHNGMRGSMRFEREGDSLRLVSLRLQGDVISRVGETCEIEVPGAPFTVTSSGRDNGLLKFSVESQSCPFDVSVLDGAVIVVHKGARASTGLGAGTCEFKEKDCRGYLAGIWGPAGRSIGENESQNIEKLRGASDKNARANFRALLRRAGRDKPKVKEIASDQAGFSARREEACRDYVREAQHGYCASRITQARAVSLAAQMGAVETDTGEAEKPKPRPRRPPPPRAEPRAQAPQGGLPAQLAPLR